VLVAALCIKPRIRKKDMSQMRVDYLSTQMSVDFLSTLDPLAEARGAGGSFVHKIPNQKKDMTLMRVDFLNNLASSTFQTTIGRVGVVASVLNQRKDDTGVGSCGCGQKDRPITSVKPTEAATKRVLSNDSNPKGPPNQDDGKGCIPNKSLKTRATASLHGDALNGRLDTLEWHLEDTTGPLRGGLLAFSSVTLKQIAFKYCSWCLDGKTAKGNEEDHEDFLNAMDLEYLDWGALTKAYGVTREKVFPLCQAVTAENWEQQGKPIEVWLFKSRKAVSVMLCGCKRMCANVDKGLVCKCMMVWE